MGNRLNVMLVYAWSVLAMATNSLTVSPESEGTHVAPRVLVKRCARPRTPRTVLRSVALPLPGPTDPCTSEDPRYNGRAGF